MSKEAMKLALEALEGMTIKGRVPPTGIVFSKAKAAHAALREALADQPAQIAGFDVVLDSSMPPNAMKFVQPAQQDIPDLIAGALGVSRGTAYDLMREALAEQATPVQEPLTDEEIKSMWRRGAIFGTNDEKAIALARAIEAARGIKEQP